MHQPVSGQPWTVTRRQAIAAAGLLALPACVTARQRGGTYDAVVAPAARTDVPAGPRHTSLGAALATAPAAGTRPFRIWIARGEWREQLTIAAPQVQLVGEDRTATRLCFTAASGLLAPDGQPYGTFRTPVITVTAPGFAATDLTIENTFDGIAEMRKAGPKLLSDDPRGPQAVALMLGGESDDAVLERVTIASHQDTFFPDAGRTILRDCLVSGSYDFIFGAGAALFDECEIRSRQRPDPAQVTGYIAAPSTLLRHATGLVFDRCSLTRDDGVPDGSVFLGRPWRPSASFPDGRYGNPEAAGMAAFLDCWMDAHIADAGWTEMWYTDRSGNPRTMLQPEEARFAEHASTGPGAHGKRRGSQISAAEAAALRQLPR